MPESMNISNNILSKYSLSFDKTALGYRINVHVYNDDINTLVKDTISIIIAAEAEAKNAGILTVPLNEPENRIKSISEGSGTALQTATKKQKTEVP